MPAPRQKEAILPEDLIAMLETLDRATLRGLRDRAMLLLGFAGGPRRSEILGLDVGRGWIEIFPDMGLGDAQGEEPDGVGSRSAGARPTPLPSCGGAGLDEVCPYCVMALSSGG